MADDIEPARLAWALFDGIVATAESESDGRVWVTNPSGEQEYQPDFLTLERLLGVPLFLGSISQSGLLAIAVDVWISYELRRAGFHPDAVWPRASEPRVLPQALATFVENIPIALRKEVVARFDRSGTSTSHSPAAPATANILGKNYVKQVDVVISDWATGPELLISTKRMDKSYSNNALNRVEESYGDAKNLRLRHPLAAIGFVFVLSSKIYDKNANLVPKIKDLLEKLGQEDDAYHAVMLVMPKYSDVGGEIPSKPGVLARELSEDLASVVARVPSVEILLAESPDNISPTRFFEKMISRVLSTTPVDFHQTARKRMNGLS